MDKCNLCKCKDDDLCSCAFCPETFCIYCIDQHLVDVHPYKFDYDDACDLDYWDDWDEYNWDDWEEY